MKQILLVLQIIFILQYAQTCYGTEPNLDAIFNEAGEETQKTNVQLDKFVNDSKKSAGDAQYEFYMKHEYVPPSAVIKDYTSDAPGEACSNQYSSDGGHKTVASPKKRSSYGIIGAGGVRRVVKNGTLNGYMSYRIECNNGSERIVKYVNNNWTTATGSSFGERYKNISINDFADKACGE